MSATTPKYRMKRWAAISGTPSCTSAGAAMVAKTMYLAVVGRPIPRIMEAIMVRKSVTIRLPPATLMINEAKRSPSPVRVTTPTTIPAQAQAAATPMALRAPFSMALKKSLIEMRVSFLRAAAAMASQML
jgi:hypothetical protein